MSWQSHLISFRLLVFSSSCTEIGSNRLLGQAADWAEALSPAFPSVFLTLLQGHGLVNSVPLTFWNRPFCLCDLRHTLGVFIPIPAFLSKSCRRMSSLHGSDLCLGGNRLTLEQWLSEDNLVPLHKGHWAVSGDILDCHDQGVVCSWYIVGGDQGCFRRQAPTQRITQPKTSAELR